jgi:hypothetical protein
MGVAHSRAGIAHKLTQDSHGLQALLWKLQVL